jgi:ATP/ADP translocase
MWFRQYYKTYYKKVGESTFSFLKKLIVIPVLVLVIPAILGVFVGNDNLGKIITPVCYGFGSLLILIISVFFYNLLHIHASIFGEDQEIIESLKKENQKLKAMTEETNLESNIQRKTNDGNEEGMFLYWYN